MKNHAAVERGWHTGSEGATLPGGAELNSPRRPGGGCPSAIPKPNKTYIYRTMLGRFWVDAPHITNHRSYGLPNHRESQFLGRGSGVYMSWTTPIAAAYMSVVPSTASPSASAYKKNRRNPATEATAPASTRLVSKSHWHIRHCRLAYLHAAAMRPLISGFTQDDPMSDLCVVTLEV